NKRGKKSVAKHFLFFHRLNIRKHRKHVGAAQIICNLNLGCVGLLDHYRILSSSSLVTESSPSPPIPRTLSGLEERAGERRPFRSPASQSSHPRSRSGQRKLLYDRPSRRRAPQTRTTVAHPQVSNQLGCLGHHTTRLGQRRHAPRSSRRNAIRWTALMDSYCPKQT